MVSKAADFNHVQFIFPSMDYALASSTTLLILYSEFDFVCIGKTATILANYSTLTSPQDHAGHDAHDGNMKTVLKYGDFGLGDVVCSVEPEIIKSQSGIPIACTCHCGSKACCLSQAQATLLVGMLSVVSNTSN